MEATVKYELCEALYTGDQQEKTVMSSMHGQYYGERQQSHSEEPPLRHPHSPSQHLHAQATQQRQSHVEPPTRQRPTHPDFAHLRHSNNTTVAQARQMNVEQSRQSHSQSAASKQTIPTSGHQSQNQNQQYSQAALKRGYHHMENGYAAIANHSSITTASVGMNTADGSSYYTPQSFMNVTPHAQNIDIFNSTYPSFNTQSNPLMPASIDGKPPKRYKKGEASLLFSPPFFKILPLPYQLAGMVSPNHKDAIAAQCYACGRIVRGNKSISSNFIKHMKRSHPEISKIYDTYKIFRIKAGIMPSITTLMNDKMQNHAVAEEVTATQDEAGDSNDENSSYFDATTMLDVSEMIEEDNHSENSENAEGSLPSGEPSENNENAGEQQETQQRDDQDKEASNSENATTNEISEKLMEAINKMMDQKLKEFVKISELPILTGETKDRNIETNIIENITHSHNNSHIDDLQNQMDQLRQECVALRVAVKQSQAGKGRLQKELQIVDKMLHQKKLIISHIKVDNPAKPQEAVQKLFKETLGLDNIEIVNCCIIPTTKGNNPASKKECVIVELQNPKNSKSVLREAHKLKDTGIFIEPEISPFQRKRKNKLMVLRKELLRRQPELKVLVRNTTLVVNSKNFYWDDIEGLCHTCNNEDLELSGLKYLKSLTGLDLTEFVDVLKNYDVQLKE